MRIRSQFMLVCLLVFISALGLAGIGAFAVHGQPQSLDTYGSRGQFSRAPALADFGECDFRLFSFRGDSIEDRLGHSVASAGDVNGDGFTDIIVGAPEEPPAHVGTGYVVVLSGLDGSELWRKSGEGTGDQFGLSVASAGDVDSNGLAEVIIGAPLFMSPPNDTIGKVYVYSPSGDSLLYSFTGATLKNGFGVTVAGVGDLDQDGYDDFGIGETGGNFTAGSAYVYSGKDTSLLWTTSGEVNTQFGQALAGVGDLDSNGYLDFIVSAHAWPDNLDESGRIYIYYNLDGATFSPLDTLDGAAPGFMFGHRVAGGGDVNLDGFDDFLVSAPRNANDTGYVYLYSGKDLSILHRFNGDTTGDNYGAALAGGGDVTGDGIPDIVAGAERNAQVFPTAGRAYVYSGSDFSRLSFISGGFGDHMGASVALVDMDNDGVSELAVGAPLESGGPSQAGQVVMLSYADADLDSIPEACDNCPSVANTDQTDVNLDDIGDACTVPTAFTLFLTSDSVGGSPANMVITDPTGDSIGVDSATGLVFNTISAGSSYFTLAPINSTGVTGATRDSILAHDADSLVDDFVTVPAPGVGNYRVRIYPAEESVGSTKFTLAIRINGNQLLLDSDYRDQNISALGTTVSGVVDWTAALTLPGDANADGITTSADIIYLVNLVFKSGPNTIVEDHGDVNCSGAVTSADIIYLVNFVFKGGQAPCSQSG